METSFERAQYAEVREKWNPGGDMEGKSASETYGAEHLMRLMGTSFPPWLSHPPVLPTPSKLFFL